MAMRVGVIRLLAAAGLISTTFLVPTPGAVLGAPSAGDPALRVIDAWDVTGPATFPGGAVLPAQRPGLTRAPNGDLLTTFNTTGDASPGGQLRLIRSTDEGRTWGPSEVIAESKLFGSKGSISATRGIATLADGTILLPYNDAVNHVNYNNRESALFVARSTDNGHTWSGTDQPVQLPIPIREAHVGGTPITELADGTLLLPIWGALELVDGWETDPMRWRSGVLRSFDGGQSWTDYRTIAYDPNNPPQFPPFHSANYTSGANELALHELPDGRLVAVIRYASGVGPNKGQVYLSYSSDAGATWTAPVATAQQAEALSLTYAPCTDRLAAGQAKLVMGHRELNAAGTRIGSTALHVSYDGGVTWIGRVALKDPTGATNLGAATGEPDFYRLSENRLLVLFQVFLPGQPSKIVANIVEDSTDTATCRADADAAAAAAVQTPTFFVDRADRAEWAWPFATRKVSFPATTTVGEVISSAAPLLSCSGSGLRVRLNGRNLDPAATLADAGVVNGSVLSMSGPPTTRRWQVGFAELDVAPENRHVYGWDDACAPAALALDFRARSLGIELRIPHERAVSAIELRDRDTSTRLTAADYRLFASADNNTYTELTGWTLTSRIQDGHLVHRFAGLNTSAPYLKIHQSRTDSAYTFVLADPRSDVTVEFATGRR